MKLAGSLPIVASVITLALAMLAEHARAGVGTAFTYQGQLNQSGTPVNGDGDLQFTLFDGADGAATQIGSMFQADELDIVEGVFTVNIDFGLMAFNGDARWLQIAVRVPHDAGNTQPFVTLSPRQPLMPAPYAMRAQVAGAVESVPGSALSGAYANPLSLTNAGNFFTGSGAGLTGLNASSVASGTLASAHMPTGGAWSLSSPLLLGGGVMAIDPTTVSVGIGTNSPLAKLHVNGEAAFGLGQADMRIREVGPFDPQDWSNLINLYGIGIGSDTGGNRQMVMVTDGFVGNRIFTVADSIDSGLTWNSRFAVHQGGNVGIGTPVPAYTLHVTSAGDRAISAHATATTGTTFGVNARSDSSAGRAVFGLANAASGATFGGWFESSSPTGTGVRGAHTAITGVEPGVLGLTNSTTEAAAGVRGECPAVDYAHGIHGVHGAGAGGAILTGGGGVFGESAAGWGVSGLSISGVGVRAGATATSGTTFGIYAIVDSPAGYAGYFNGRCFFISNVGLGVLNPAFQLHLSANSAAKPTSNTWTISSDARLKKNINTIEHALDDLLALRGVTYQWKDPASQGNMTGTYTGMIAQDVEKVFPEWIGEDANGFKHLTVIGFEGIVVEALRELRAENDAQNEDQQTRIEAVEAENADLRARLDRLEEMLQQVLAGKTTGGAQ